MLSLAHDAMVAKVLQYESLGWTVLSASSDCVKTKLLLFANLPLEYKESG